MRTWTGSWPLVRTAPAARIWPGCRWSSVRAGRPTVAITPRGHVRVLPGARGFRGAPACRCARSGALPRRGCSCPRIPRLPRPPTRPRWWTCLRDLGWYPDGGSGVGTGSLSQRWKHRRSHGSGSLSTSGRWWPTRPGCHLSLSPVGISDGKQRAEVATDSPNPRVRLLTDAGCGTRWPPARRHAWGIGPDPTAFPRPVRARG